MALLNRLERSGGWGPSPQLQASVTAAEAARTESIEKAKEQYAAAIESLGMLRTPANTNSQEIAAMKEHAEQALQRIDQRAAAAGGAPASGGSAAAPAGGSGASSGAAKGAESPEALIAIMSAAAEPGADLDAVVAVVRSGNPQLQKVMTDMMVVMKPMQDASMRAFGRAPDMSGGDAPGMSLPADARVVSQDATSAVVEATGPTGPQRFPLVNVDGRWFLDLDALLESEAPGKAAMIASAAPMMGAMSASMSAAAKAVAARIDSGEITSPDQVMAEFQKEMMKSLPAGMGGAAGSPPPGASPGDVDGGK